MLGAFSQISTAKPLLISSSSSSSLSSPSGKGRCLNTSSRNFPLASRIFVRNLSYSISEASLIKLFSRFGHIIDIEIPRHEESKHSKGYAFIQYCSQEDAILAVEEIDRKWINGRLVYAEIAKPLHGIAYPKTSGPPLQQSSVSNESRN
ncbi:small RNA-binding protein 11, chloroplastic [Dendrobium catenatum]|uniref:small RNA-binding protein 11, chloroplastic n=1 Tax=Dendrobium catenatum TaxID=906689 RepID=UPI0009F6F589|nr:small RNA-binding protein 11, chloroplastic [Dendrobium catenatum]XP_020694491.1 small RNA-binding protein 11, chloroplastic [Dendrobium catenatum]